MPTVYHLLDESETFSEANGGAISRWAANVLREGTEIVICPSFDATWNFPPERVYCLPGWARTSPPHPLLYRIPWPLQEFIYRRVFRELMERIQPGDVLYTHNRPESAAVLALLGKERGFQVVLHMHNSHLTRANRGQLAALKDVPIVLCSDFLRKELAARLPGRFSRMFLVYNGADHGRFFADRTTSNKVPEVIFTGRLVAYKGVHILLEAMRLLQQRGIEAKCKIVGGSAFGNSRQTGYVKKLHRTRPSNVEFAGYVKGAACADLLRQADIFCCPSIWNEPFPLSLLEAMASKLPVVASRTGGIPEALAFGGGELVPPNDAPALASALQRMIEDRGYREQLGAAAFQSFSDHFLWSSVRTQYEAVLREILPEIRPIPQALTR